MVFKVHEIFYRIIRLFFFILLCHGWTTLRSYQSKKNDDWIIKAKSHSLEYMYSFQ